MNSWLAGNLLILYGAMENWGLNTYKPIFLLYTANVSTEQERGVISHTLAHELGHQWFGNLVTCSWWNDIWLNEGLTTYASVIAWQHTQPEFEPLKYFHVNAFQNSLLLEEFGTSKMRNEENNGTVQIIDNFDNVTPRKGACLVKMMESFLGIETVRKGIVNYLHELSYQDATQDDFFAYLHAQAESDGVLLAEGLKLEEIMDTWTYNRGFPILYVHNVSGDDQHIHIQQEQYRGQNSEQENSAGWHIPLTFVTEDNPNFDVQPKLIWMKPLQMQAKIQVQNVNKWIVVNPNAKGYYRVVYNEHFTRLIWKVLARSHTTLSPETRSQLIDDYFMAAFQNTTTKYVTIEDALGFTKYLGKEYERIVWETLLLNLRSTFYQLIGTETFGEFKKYFMPKILSALSIIGFRQESHHKGANVILRSLLLDWVCTMGSDDCDKYTNEFMQQWSQNPIYNPIPPDLQNAIYCNAIANGNSSTHFDFILGKYEADGENDVQKSRFLNALACSKQPIVLQRLLNDAANSENSTFDDSDRVLLIQKITMNYIGRNLTLHFLQSYLTMIMEGIGLTGITKVVNTLSKNMATVEELAQVNKFINDNAVVLESVLPKLQSYLLNMQKNIEWRSMYELRFRNWFKNNNK